MSRLCPKDMKPCIDDICHGAGCVRMGGYQMLEVCEWCGGINDDELSITCACDDDDCPPYDDEPAARKVTP